MQSSFSALALASLVFLCGCAGVQPQPPRIERLPDGAAGPIVPATPRPLGMAQVAEMARGGSPANVIVQALRDSRASYAISSAEANDLSRQGVPYEVIEYLRFGERQPVVVYVQPPSHVHSYVHPYPYAAYAPLVVVPGIYYSRWGFGRHPRHPAAGVHLRFGFRR